MRFIVSQRFKRHQDIRKMGERYFRLLPPWVQASPCSNCVVVIVTSLEDPQNVSRSVKLVGQESLLELEFKRKISVEYVDFFGQMIKKVVHSENLLNQVFLTHVRALVVEGVCNQEDVADALVRHLVWYFLDKNALNGWNPERFRLCQQIANDLLCASSEQGALIH